MKHLHHIIPKHMGGTDDPSNLIELTVEEHAEAHKKLYEEHSNEYDLIAYRMLAGHIGSEEAIHAAQVEGQRRRWTKEAREEQSRKMMNNKIAKPRSEETKRKISEAHKGMKKPWAINPVMNGKDNPRARKVYAEGVIYDTVRACTEAHALKHHNNVRHRCNSEKWPNWYYC